MASGQTISAIGHGALLAWLLIGGLFSNASDEPIEVSTVALISSEEFAALSAPNPVPDAPQNIPTPPQPEPQTPAEITPPVAETPPPADEAPDVVEAPAPLEETPETPPVVQPPAENTPVVLAPPATTSSPRPAPRVAPTPVEAPPPDVEIADETQEAVTPDAQTPAPTETDPVEPTAQEEANERIVTEADEPASSAPTRSARPSSRPSRPTPPVETAAASTRDAISDALADVQQEAAASQASAQTSAPVGPPLSYGEKDALRVAVSSCWVVDIGGASSRVTVVVGVRLEENGKVVGNSLRLISSEGGDATAVKVAFRNARSAITRCQKGGYKLPIEKYSHWREIVITFNPDKMRIN